jgi:NAD(P)H-nitrite reductase large subunit
MSSGIFMPVTPNNMHKIVAISASVDDLNRMKDAHPSDAKRIEHVIATGAVGLEAAKKLARDDGSNDEMISMITTATEEFFRAAVLLFKLDLDVRESQ